MPIALSELIRARLARLPGPAQQVLQSAAVLDPDFDLALLRRASGRDEQETLDALDTLLGAAVLVERSGGRGDEYAFAHPLVATIVRAGSSGARRAFLNRRAAEAIVATHAGRLPPVAGRLAAHYAEAGDLAQAATYAESAGDYALSLAAFDEAVAFFRRALDTEPRLPGAWGWGGR